LLDLIGAMTLAHRPQWTTTLAVYKWVLREMGWFEHDTVAPPTEPLTETDQRRLRDTVLPLIRQLEAVPTPEARSQ
jgi:hypothetical protein